MPHPVTQGSWDQQLSQLDRKPASPREGLRMERAVPSHTGYFLDAQDATGLGGASAEDGEPQGSDGEQDMGPRLL